MDCYKLEMTRKAGSDMSYSRMIMWVAKDNYIPVVIDYFDENDQDYLLKTLVQSDIVTIDGIPTARKITMYNKTDNTETSMTMRDISYNIPMEDELFTERGMKK